VPRHPAPRASTWATRSRPARAGARGSSSLRSLEEGLPAREQRVGLVARAPVGGDSADVGPVVGQRALELGDPLLAAGDLGLEALELRWRRRRFAFRLRLQGRGGPLRRRRRRRRLSLVAAPEV